VYINRFISGGYFSLLAVAFGYKKEINCKFGKYEEFYLFDN
jgi:hypothetical protein